MFFDYRINIPAFVQFIIDRLKSKGFKAYIVGGAIRDTLMNRSVTDWDIATMAIPQDIRSIFSDFPHFHLKHDTVTIVQDSAYCEITNFRKSLSNSLDPLVYDLSCRDFTINSMAYDTDKKLIMDPFKGRRDISKKEICATENPEKRFHEDPLRLLRAVRLASELGFKIEKKTRNIITEMAPEIRKIPTERVREELIKVLMIPKPSLGLRLMKSMDLMKWIIPELLEGYHKKQNHYHKYTIYRHILETVDETKINLLQRVTALLHDIAKPRVRKKIAGIFRFYEHEKASAELAEEIMHRFKFSNEFIGNVTNLISNHLIGYKSDWSDAAIRRLIMRVGFENIGDLIEFRKADLLAHGHNDHGLDEFEEMKMRVANITKGSLALKTTDLAIDGRAVMKKLGIPPGPKVGMVLERLLEKVIEDPALNKEEKLIEILTRQK